jgi:hypothetical protein
MDELKKIAPTLSSLEKKNPFLVSEEYFEDLPHTIVDKIHFSEAKKVNISGLLLKFGIPCLLICAFYVWNKYPSYTNTTQLSSSEIEEYIENNSTYSTTDLSEELAEIQQDIYSNSSEIEEYLLTNDIDENLLREEIKLSL